MIDIVYSFANSSDTTDIKQLLSKCGLPQEGILDDLKHFLTAKSNGKLIGVIGLEIYGSSGLIRSFAVSAEFRRNGIGKNLYTRLMAHAYLQNIRDLYLLTTTAEDFFKKLGFTRIDRNLAPTSLKSSLEFQTLCPISAVCMVKHLNKEAIYFSQDILRLKPDVEGAKMWGVALDKTLLTYFELEPNCRFDKHTHESEQITMVLDGELFFELENGIFCVGKNEVIAIPSNITHTVFTREKTAKAVDAWSPVMPQYVKNS